MNNRFVSEFIRFKGQDTAFDHYIPKPYWRLNVKYIGILGITESRHLFSIYPTFTLLALGPSYVIRYKLSE